MRADEHTDHPTPFYSLVSLLVPPGIVLAAVVIVAVLTRGTGNSLGTLSVFWSVFNGPLTIVMGLFIWRRVRGNAVGPLLALWGVQNSLWAVPTTELKAITAAFALGTGMLTGCYLLIYFPNGRPFPHRTARLYLASFILLAVNGLVFVLAHPTFRTVVARISEPHPLYLPLFAPLQPLTELVQNLSLLFWIWGPLTLILRYRGASPKEQLQIKWMAFLALLMIPAVVILILGNAVYGESHPQLFEFFLAVSFTVFQLAPAIFIGISVLRYRLWDVDILIRRTVTYTILTALLLGVFLGSVIVFQQVFAAVTGARQNELVTVLSTLVIAALFVPLRNRLQQGIDRRFYRRRYDAAQVLRQFGEMVRDETDLEELTGRLLEMVDETMKPARVSLWLRDANTRPRKPLQAEERG